MMWYKLDVAAFCFALAASLLATALFRRLAVRWDFLDRPAANHKAHAHPVPLLGGAGMFTAWLGCLAAGAAAVLLHQLPGFDATFALHLPGFSLALRQLGFLVLGATLAVVLGVIDDKYPLSAAVKFSGQFVIAVLAVWGGGIRINLFLSCAGASCGVTVFWLMLLMNSINFFDNMDGLAAGVIAIAMAAFALVAALNGQYFFALFAAVNCGVCCGFWCFNAAPATIFMGDSGSHFLGFLAGVTAAGVTYFHTGSGHSFLAVLMPLFILALPLFDTAMVVVIRTWNRRPFWIGDHNHISHRFQRMGMSRPAAVAVVHLLALTLALGALPLLWCDRVCAAVLALQAVLILGVVTLLQFCAGPDRK